MYVLFLSHFYSSHGTIGLSLLLLKVIAVLLLTAVVWTLPLLLTSCFTSLVLGSRRLQGCPNILEVESCRIVQRWGDIPT